MIAVEIMLSIIFCAVPAFILVDPVTISGPTITSTGYRLIPDKSEFLEHVMLPVTAPILLAYSIAPIT